MADISQDKAQALNALREIAETFCEAIVAAGASGAPAGILYAAAMSHMSLRTFEQIMSALVAAKRIRQQGNLYFSA